MRSFEATLLVLATSAVGYAMPSATSPAKAQAAASIISLASYTANHAVQGDLSPMNKAHVFHQQCIHFTSENPNWHFANDGVWGNDTGTFGDEGRTICVPTNDDAGGAMFIGSQPTPSAGSTKLECYFPTSNNASTANCDMSLVDGYSLSVTCHASGKKVGGALDLWRANHRCVNRSMKHLGICKNDKGYADLESDVTPFFQAGIQDGNQYCIWVNCSQNPYFLVGSHMHCHVSGTGVR